MLYRTYMDIPELLEFAQGGELLDFAGPLAFEICSARTNQQPSAAAGGAAGSFLEKLQRAFGKSYL